MMHWSWKMMCVKKRFEYGVDYAWNRRVSCESVALLRIIKDYRVHSVHFIQKVWMLLFSHVLVICMAHGASIRILLQSATIAECKTRFIPRITKLFYSTNFQRNLIGKQISISESNIARKMITSRLLNVQNSLIKIT